VFDFFFFHHYKEYFLKFRYNFVLCSLNYTIMLHCIQSTKLLLSCISKTSCVVVPFSFVLYCISFSKYNIFNFNIIIQNHDIDVERRRV